MQTKTFRLFISSTFNDFRREREVLQTKVFPHIKEYTSKQGYTFQPIDLRWGVSNEAQLDQKTLELCLSEVRACKTHIHPNFLIMIGDRYGWVPLPYAIEVNEFEELLLHVNSDEKQQLLEWYIEDLNQLPASYVLKERTNKYEEFDVWAKVETTLRDILQSAVNKSNLNEEQKRKYFLSATEAEVEEGIVPYINPTAYQNRLLEQNNSLMQVDPQHIFGFFRDVDKTTQIENKFIVDDYEEAQEFKTRVKKELLEDNILHVNTKQVDKDRLEEEYLTQFKETMIKFLEKQVDSQKQKEDTLKQTPLQIELAAQSYFAINKRKNFLAQEELRETIANYIINENSQPLVIYGKSGRGKSALMSKAIEEAKDSSQKRVLYRFIGATPNSGSSKEILTSIFNELGKDISSEKEKQETKEDLLFSNSNEDQETFEDFSYKVYDELKKLEEDVVVFIDAVDQLENDDQFLWLPQQLPSNVKIVISALEDEKYQEDSKYLQALKIKTTNLHIISEFNEASKLLHVILEQENRTIQPEQEEYFLKQYEKIKSPLYVTIAAQEIKNWKSSDNSQTLADTQQGIIQEFIDNLSEFFHHNKVFVRKVLGYIYASRDGLSESELLQLLSVDKEFVQKMAPETWHENPNRELPLVHWSRLHTQLKQFLSLKTQDEEELMYFFHREFERTIEGQEHQQTEHEEIIEATQKLILKNQYEEFNANRWGRLYIILITEYDLIYQHKKKLKGFTEFITKIKNRIWIDSCISTLTHAGNSFSKYHLQKNTISYRQTSLYITTTLYNKEPMRWIEAYVNAALNFSISLSSTYSLEEALSILKTLHPILKKLFQEKLDSWKMYYILLLISLSHVLNLLDRKHEAIELQREIKSYNFNEKLIGNNNYIAYIVISSMSYLKSDLEDEAIQITKNAIDSGRYLIKSGFKQDIISLGLAIGLSNLAFLYKQAGSFKDVIELEEEALEIRRKFYKINSKLWKYDYITLLKNLILSCKEKNINEKVLMYENELSQINEKTEESIHQIDFSASLINLIIPYNDEKDLNKIIALEKKLSGLNNNIYIDRYQYISSLNDNDIYLKYKNISDLDFEIYEELVVLRKKLYIKNPLRWGDYYTSLLNNISYYYYYNKHHMYKTIQIKEELLDALTKLDMLQSKVWIKKRLIILENVASLKANVKQLKLASNLFSQYFEYINFNIHQDIDTFIYPYILWYQCEYRLGNLEKLAEMEAKVQDIVSLYKSNMKNKYDIELKKKKLEYLKLRESKNTFDREKYFIFLKLFYEGSDVNIMQSSKIAINDTKKWWQFW